MVYLTTGEVARRCQVSVGTVKNWIEAGQLEAFRTPGGHFRIKSSALRQFQSAFGFPADPDDRPRILVVDDQREFVDLAIDSLKVLLPDARLEGAGGGYEALLRIGSLQPHVLLLDLRMPGLDGFEVCRRVKEAPASKGTRIVAMTWTSLRKPFGNDGRSGRSISRAVRIAVSEGRPSRRKNDPGILPTAYIRSSTSTVSGKKSSCSFGCAEATAVTSTCVSPTVTTTAPSARLASLPDSKR